MTRDIHGRQGSVIGYDFWDLAGERPGRDIGELAADYEGSYAWGIGPITITADVAGYGRAAAGVSILSVSGEYRIPISEVPEVIISIENLVTGEDATVPGDFRGVVQVGPVRGRVTEDFSTGTTVIDLGSGLGVPFGSSFAGLSYHEQYGVGGAASLGFPLEKMPPGRVGVEAGVTFSFGLYLDFGSEVMTDPAGGSGVGVQSPGSGNGLRYGYEGRGPSGGMLAGDELSVLDEIAQRNAFSRQPHEVNPNGFSREAPSGDRDPRNDNDWRIPVDDWRHSGNRNDSDDGGNHNEGSRGKTNGSDRTSRGPDALEGPEATKDVKSQAPSPHKGAVDGHGRSHDDPGFVGPHPLILDLDGSGIQLTELSQSTTFIDADNSGLLHRTAWAGAGDGVLFYDVNGDGAITETREYVFTEWDPTAASDLEALRAVFDSNSDGKLTAADDAWASFKVMVTQADGSLVAMTLDQFGITEIDLTGDATFIELPDGSVITGQTTFTRSDGTTGTVADMILQAEAQGYRVEQAVSIDGSGNGVVEITGFYATGDVAFAETSVTSQRDSSAITDWLLRRFNFVSIKFRSKWLIGRPTRKLEPTLA